MITFFVISNLRVHREAVASVASTFDEVEFVGGAASLSEALPTLRNAHPSVIVLDMTDDHEPPLEVITSEVPGSRILACGVAVDPETLRTLVAAGVAGFLTHDASLADLIRGVIATSRGGFMDSPGLVGMLLAHARSNEEFAHHDRPDEHLSSREREIAHLVQHGYSNREIAELLSIAEQTVKNHVHRILSRFGLKNRAALATWITQGSTLTQRVQNAARGEDTSHHRGSQALKAS